MGEETRIPQKLVLRDWEDRRTIINCILGVENGSDEEPNDWQTVWDQRRGASKTTRLQIAQVVCFSWHNIKYGNLFFPLTHFVTAIYDDNYNSPLTVKNVSETYVGQRNHLTLAQGRQQWFCTSTWPIYGWLFEACKKLMLVRMCYVQNQEGEKKRLLCATSCRRLLLNFKSHSPDSLFQQISFSLATAGSKYVSSEEPIWAYYKISIFLQHINQPIQTQSILNAQQRNSKIHAKTKFHTTLSTFSKRQYVRMYACICIVCIYVCLQVCMYICIYACVYVYVCV